MNWLYLIKFLMPIIIELIGGLGEKDECPDGVCPPVVEDLKTLQVEMDQPRAADAKSFFECFDFSRAFAAISELVAVVRNAITGVCPPSDSV